MRNGYFLLLLAVLSWPALSQEIQIPDAVIVTGKPTSLGNIASIQGVPVDDGVAGVYGRSTSAGVYGASSSGSGVVGITHTGDGGTFFVYGDGTALHASTKSGPSDAIALEVDGPMLKTRNPRNLLRVFNPDTGALVGEFEFEIVVEP